MQLMFVICMPPLIHMRKTIFKRLHVVTHGEHSDLQTAGARLSIPPLPAVSLVEVTYPNHVGLPQLLAPAWEDQHQQHTSLNEKSTTVGQHGTEA